ncbi:MAG: glycoside hydrolase family 15 protein, partial [Methylocystis sp.]
MAWVAFDRAAKMAATNGDDEIARRWRRTADDIHAQVRAKGFDEGFDEGLGSFVQFYGARKLDASLLQIPLVGFLPPTHPQVRGTL